MLTPSLKQGILNKALLVSVGLKERMIETYGIENFNYLSETELETYFNHAVLFIESELNQMGIQLIPTIDLMHDPVHLELILTLRSVFEGRYFHRILSESEMIRECVQQVLENNTYDPSLLITSLITEFHRLAPIATSWQKLYNHRHSFTNTNLFIAHVQAIMGKPSLITDAVVSKQTRYVKSIYLHINNVKQVIAALANRPENELRFTDFNFTNYDRDLVNMPMDAVDMYLDSGNPHPLLRREVGDIPFIAQHKRNTDHHFEYYIQNQIVEPAPQQLASLVAEYCIPEWSRDTRIEVISGFLKLASFSNEVNQRILQMVSML
jgi:hypothetical protein